MSSPRTLACNSSMACSTKIADTVRSFRSRGESAEDARPFRGTVPECAACAGGASHERGIWSKKSRLPAYVKWDAGLRRRGQHGREQAMAVGVVDGLGTGAHVELAEDVGDVGAS